MVVRPTVVVVVVGAVVVVVGAVVVVVGAVVVVVGAVVVVVGAVVVVVGAVVVVVAGGIPGTTPPLSSVLKSWLSAVAMHTSVDAQETKSSWFVVPPVSACQVEPPLPVPASDTVVPHPAVQHVKALVQLIELVPESLAGKGTVAHVAPESALVARARLWELSTAPPAKQTVVPVGHDTDARAPNWPRVGDCDWDQVVPLDAVDTAVDGPDSESAPTATQLEADEQEMSSR